jgi:hypothetical protein
MKGAGWTFAVLAFIRGDADADALDDPRIEMIISDDGVRMWEAPGVPTVVPSQEDVASGLLANYARGTTLKQWASVVLAANFIDFVELEVDDDELLLEALWAASAGEEISEESLRAARELADR